MINEKPARERAKNLALFFFRPSASRGKKSRLAAHAHEQLCIGDPLFLLVSALQPRPAADRTNDELNIVSFLQFIVHSLTGNIDTWSDSVPVDFLPDFT